VHGWAGMAGSGGSEVWANAGVCELSAQTAWGRRSGEADRPGTGGDPLSLQGFDQSSTRAGMSIECRVGSFPG
jgi:hypothetical protein